MSLDERLRTELRAIATGELREDEALDTVVRKHDRGLALGQVTRHALAVAVVVSLFASVAMVVAWRTPDHTGAAAAGDRYRSTATIRIAPAENSGSTSTTIDSGLKPADPRALALTPSTERTALAAARLPADDIRFLASLNRNREILSLTVTAPTSNASTAVTHQWASAFVKARRDEAIRLLRAADHRLTLRVEALHRRLDVIDAELIRIDPTTFNDRNLRYNPPNSHSFTDKMSSAPPVPEHGSTHELNLANERIQLLATLADLGAQAASSRIVSLGTNVLATVISQTPAVRIHTPSSSRTAPVLIGWAIGLLVVLAAALFVYRRRTRAVRQVAA